jgi:hypothetical protein
LESDSDKLINDSFLSQKIIQIFCQNFEILILKMISWQSSAQSCQNLNINQSDTSLR